MKDDKVYDHLGKALGGLPDYSRPILVEKVKDGLFVVPKDFDAKDEVEFAKRRMDTIRVSQYADSKCGLPHTFDPTGAYLCHGRKDGSSSPCNKITGSECLIRIKSIPTGPPLPSCAFWEIHNAGDPEGRYCPKGKMGDDRIGYGTTNNPLGFGCIRCEYGQNKLPHLDSEGRGRWCELKGHPVEDNACCWDNDPLEKD